jgi:site-specific DNA-methyltransferase (adenine-specific)
MEINKIYLEDNLETLSRMEDDFYDLIVTSPPYDGIRKYNGFIFDMDKLTSELFRTIKKGGVIVWVVNDQVVKGSETGTSFRQALKFMDAGFNLHDTMIYEKNSSSYPSGQKNNRYTQIFEYMFVFSKGKPKTANLICDKPNKWAGFTNWGKNTKRLGDNEQLIEIEKIKPVPDFSPRNNIWRYVNGGGFASKDKIAHKHPAIFPEELAKDHILTWSNEGDIVYDPFMGSGTVAKMSILLNRKYIGSEISKDYVDICLERINITLNPPEKKKKGSKKKVNLEPIVEKNDIDNFLED